MNLLRRHLRQLVLLARTGAYRRLCIILRLDISDFAGLDQLLPVQLLKIDHKLIGRPRLTNSSVLNFGDRGLGTLDRGGNVRLRHAKPLEFEGDVLDVHEHRL